MTKKKIILNIIIIFLKNYDCNYYNCSILTIIIKQDYKFDYNFKFL